MMVLLFDFLLRQATQAVLTHRLLDGWALIISNILIGAIQEVSMTVSPRGLFACLVVVCAGDWSKPRHGMSIF